MGRYEVNTLVGVGLSAAVFIGSAFFDRREEPFKTRIEAFEHDMETPAYAPPGTRLDLRGLQAYRLAGRLSVIIGALLLLLALPLFGEGSTLNGIGGMLGVGLGMAVELAVRRYEERHAGDLGEGEDD
jgi:hypothetical protein